MKDKQKIINHYGGIKKSLDTALEVIRESNIDDEDNKKLMNKLRGELNSLNVSFKADIDKLEKQSEWDKLCIAFFGETNAGKSTLIEALRILYNEQTRMNALKRSTEEFENALSTNNKNLQQVNDKLNDYVSALNNYAIKIHERERKYQTDIINLQKALQYCNTESDKKQKHLQAIITNLQSSLGITIDNAAKQEKIYNNNLLNMENRYKKLKMIAIAGCFLCIVLGYFLASYM